MKKLLNKTRIIVWSLAILFIVLFAFFGPSSIVQNRNMNKAHIFCEKVKTYNEFENIKVSPSTANLGRNIVVIGTLKTEEDLLKLKGLANENLPPRFHVSYFVELEEDLFAGNWQGSGTDSEGNAYTFAAKVVDLGGGQYRVLILDKLDTQKEPMHIMDGTLKGNQFPYTSDGGLYTGGGTLKGDTFEGYYKGPVDGTYQMHRVR